MRSQISPAKRLQLEESYRSVELPSDRVLKNAVLESIRSQVILQCLMSMSEGVWILFSGIVTGTPISPPIACFVISLGVFCPLHLTSVGSKIGF